MAEVGSETTSAITSIEKSVDARNDSTLEEAALAPAPAASATAVPPDGGYRAWAAVAGTILCQFSSFGLINA